MAKKDLNPTGRGARINTPNHFLKQALTTEHPEGLDEALVIGEKTQVFTEHPKTVVNKMTSPDIPMFNTINPYQGCEHGCVYCYARNAHTYYGFSAGIDFESRIVAKPGAAALLRRHFEHKNYVPESITLSGNTDCYQPIERKLKITRSLLEVMLEYKNPVSIITKNNLILRDTDLLSELARYNLVHVMISLTSLREQTRLLLEPRTATAKKRLHAMEQLTVQAIPVGVMTAPIIPGLNSDEIPALIKAAADAGALSAAYTVVRLNGAVKDIFYNWLHTTMPGSAGKIWNQIKACHNGQVNDSRFGKRMSGDGTIAESIKQLFQLAKRKYMAGRKMPEYDFTHFKKPLRNGMQIKLF